MTTIGAGGFYELQIAQGAKFRRGFRSKVDGQAVSLAGYEWASQIRRKESTTSDLIADLTEHISVDTEDDTILWLSLNANETRALDIPKAGAFWDLFLWRTGQSSEADLLVQGSVTFDRATSTIEVLG